MNATFTMGGASKPAGPRKASYACKRHRLAMANQLYQKAPYLVDHLNNCIHICIWTQMDHTIIVFQTLAYNTY